MVVASFQDGGSGGGPPPKSGHERPCIPLPLCSIGQRKLPGQSKSRGTESISGNSTTPPNFKVKGLSLWLVNLLSACSLIRAGKVLMSRCIKTMYLCLTRAYFPKYTNSLFNPITTTLPTTQLKNGQKTQIDIFPKKTYSWPIGIWKDPQLCQSLEKCNSKLQWGLTSHYSEEPSIKSLQINAGEGMEKRESSYTIGGNVNWCTHYGKQYGGSLKI